MDRWNWSLEAKKALKILDQKRIYAGTTLHLYEEEADFVRKVLQDALNEFGYVQTIPEIRHEIGELGQMIASDTMGGCPYTTDELVDELIKSCNHLKDLWREQEIIED